MFKKLISRFALWSLDRLIEPIPANAHQIVRRGYARADVGDFDGAIADFSTAIELVPHYGDAFRLRAETFLLKHDVQSAMKDILEDLRLRPENAETHAIHGDVLREMQQYSDAMSMYERALALDPNSASGLVGRAYCHYNNGDWESAIADFRRGLAQSSKDKDAQVCLRKAGRNKGVRNLLFTHSQTSAKATSRFRLGPVLPLPDCWKFSGRFWQVEGF